MFDNLSAYIEEHATDTDIFCFQEVFHTTSDDKRVEEEYRANLLWALILLLPDYQVYYAPAQEWYGFKQPVAHHLERWIALFIKKDLPVTDHGVGYVYGTYNSKMLWTTPMTARNYQWVSLPYGETSLTIAHFHGLWTWGGKDDTPERLEQSRVLNDFMDSRDWQVLLLGDYNLNPDTQSLAILTQGRRNLISEYKITTTRSALYTKPLPYADYAIVSPDVPIKSFSVPYTEASDHLPLEVEVG